MPSRWILEYRKEKALLVGAWFMQMQRLIMVMVLLLFGLSAVDGVLPDPRLVIWPLLWLLYFMVLLMESDRFFLLEKQEGILFYYAQEPLARVVQWLLMRMLTRWVFMIMPVLLAGAFLAWVLGMEPMVLGYSLAAQCLAAPYLLLWTMLGACCVVSVPHSGFLMGVLLLPFYAPILFLGQGLYDPLVLEMGAGAGALMLISALSLLAIMGIPYIMAVVLRKGPV